MKKVLLIVSFILTTNLVKSQNSIGWYHLLEGAQTRVLSNWVDNNKTDVWYGVDEILLVYEVKGDIGFAIDIDGRLVQILNMNRTKKVNLEGRVVKMIKEVDVSLNKKLNSNNNVWLVGFNSVNGTAKILLSTDEIIEVPKNTYIELTQFQINSSKGYPIHKTTAN